MESGRLDGWAINGFKEIEKMLSHVNISADIGKKLCAYVHVKLSREQCPAGRMQ